jgi:ribose-phosphate pyrophosphokinase
MIEVIVGPKDRFSEALAKNLGVPFVELERIVFPDSEVKPKIAGIVSLAGKEVLLVNRTKAGIDFYPNRLLVELLFTLMNVRDAKAKRITVLVPYLIYARQDKVFLPGEPPSAKYVLGLLKAAGADALLTVTSHMQREEGEMNYFPALKAHNISAFPAIGAYLKAKYCLNNPLVVGPDMGTEKGAAEVAEALGAAGATLKKERDRVSGKIQTKGQVEAKGRDVVIVDDIAASGVTLENAVKLCKQAGAGKVICAVAHAVLAGSCLQRVRGAGAELVATNTIDSEVSVIDVAGSIAGYIRKNGP